MTEETTRTEAKKKKAATTSDKHTPVHVIREGGIAASIWQKTTAHGMRYLEFTLSRSWQSKSGTSGYSSAFFARNQDALTNVVKQAAVWIEAAEKTEAATQTDGAAA